MICQKKGCKAFAMKNSTFCFSHNPKVRKKHLEAVKKGGEATSRAKMTLAEPLDLSQTKDLLVLLQETVNRVRLVNQDGSIDIKTANCIGFLCSKIIEIKKQLALEGINVLSEEDLREFERWKITNEAFDRDLEEDPLRVSRELKEMSDTIYKYELQESGLIPDGN